MELANLFIKIYLKYPNYTPNQIYHKYKKIPKYKWTNQYNNDKVVTNTINFNEVLSKTNIFQLACKHGNHRLAKMIIDLVEIIYPDEFYTQRARGFYTDNGFIHIYSDFHIDGMLFTALNEYNIKIVKYILSKPNIKIDRNIHDDVTNITIIIPRSCTFEYPFIYRPGPIDKCIELAKLVVFYIPQQIQVISPGGLPISLTLLELLYTEYQFSLDTIGDTPQRLEDVFERHCANICAQPGYRTIDQMYIRLHYKKYITLIQRSRREHTMHILHKTLQQFPNYDPNIARIIYDYIPS